jgi:hypothetical protein
MSETKFHSHTKPQAFPFSCSEIKNGSVDMNFDANSQEFRLVFRHFFPLSHIDGIFLARQITNGIYLAQNAHESTFYFKQLEDACSVFNHLLRWFLRYLITPHQLQRLLRLCLPRQGSDTANNCRYAV